MSYERNVGERKVRESSASLSCMQTKKFHRLPFYFADLLLKSAGKRKVKIELKTHGFYRVTFSSKIEEQLGN